MHRGGTVLKATNVLLLVTDSVPCRLLGLTKSLSGGHVVLQVVADSRLSAEETLKTRSPGWSHTGRSAAA